MYRLQNNNLFITTLLTFSIFTTMTVMVHQEVFGSSIGGLALTLSER
jgi:hypothetical protein